MDRRTMEAAIAEARRGGAVALAIIVDTRGSTPRKPGAALAAGPRGLLGGSVGGGALEARVLETASAVASGGACKSIRFGLDGVEVAGDLPICGGQAEVAVIAVADPSALAAAAALLDAGGSAVLVFGGASEPRICAILDGEGGPAWGACAADAAALGRALGGELARDPAGLVYDPVLAPERLLILGGGHVGRALARVALDLAFDVTVADPRPGFSDPESLPPGARALRAAFTEAVTRFEPGARDYAVVVSPDHQGDIEALRALLGRGMRYIGLIGSRRKTRMILAELVAEGFDEGSVSRLCTPIGLDIGAETPEEIAVSIAAELIAYRRGARCLSRLGEERRARRELPST